MDGECNTAAAMGDREEEEERRVMDCTGKAIISKLKKKEIGLGLIRPTFRGPLITPSPSFFFFFSFCLL